MNELVSNALKHAFPAGTGRVAVTTRLEGAVLVLEVADDGAGKDEDARQGLGTRIVQGLVDRLGGSMTSIDAAPGHRLLIRTPHGAA